VGQPQRAQPLRRADRARASHQPHDGRRSAARPGFSLQADIKTNEGTEHPDRDAQFGYLNTLVKARLQAKQPVTSVDTKKKELVGEFKTGGRELRPKSDSLAVNVHDFVTELGRANPYGVYDLAANSAWVSVGTDHDTASFAVQTIRRLWQQMGRSRYTAATELTITADCGGSNGYRTWLWKVELQDLATNHRSRSPSPTCRPAQAHGIASSTASSATSR